MVSILHINFFGNSSVIFFRIFLQNAICQTAEQFLFLLPVFTFEFVCGDQLLFEIQFCYLNGQVILWIRVFPFYSSYPLLLPTDTMLLLPWSSIEYVRYFALCPGLSHLPSPLTQKRTFRFQSFCQLLFFIFFIFIFSRLKITVLHWCGSWFFKTYVSLNSS